jgi:2,3,4,5-tetrahydropyridine-2,6-dicarboxylate N-succinyltransferase
MKEESIIQECWENREILKEKSSRIAIDKIIKLLDKGELRVAEPLENGKWKVNEWVKKAILLYFPIQEMTVSTAGIFEYHDKMALKSGYQALGIRVVPPAVARYGSYMAKGVILMPSYVNIGAYIDEGTMVDTWATVGSCAQIGKNVHLSGGVGIGGVLEPVQASPVIIEDGAFIGSRCIVVEGAHVAKRAVLGAGVVITGSSKIIDVTGPEPIEYKGFVPEDSVVIPGSLPKTFAAGTYQVPCALIIGKRRPSTDLKTSLNEALRENQVSI